MSLTPHQRTEILASIKKRVLKHHVNVAGVKYETWVKLVDERTPNLLNVKIDEFENGVRDLLKELGTSHTVFYHERTIRVLPQHSLNATLRAFNKDGQECWTFQDVFEDGPAHRAGVKPGDILHGVDGTPYQPPSMPPFKLGQTFHLTVSSPRGQERREIEIVVPYRKGTKDRPPIIEPKSLTYGVVAPRVGILKIAYFPGPMGLEFAKMLDSAIGDLKRQSCDRLIVDLRGNIGGGLGFARLASYLCSGKLPIGHSLTPGRLRRGYRPEDLLRVPMPQTRASLILTLGRFAFRDKSIHLLTQGLGTQPFHGRIAVLVNEWTNSAAEMVANFAAENRLAILIGTRTPGNVLGAMNFHVGSSYWLRLPIFGWYTSKGHCLEGKGVAPDIVVESDPYLLNAGTDQQLNKALDVLGSAAARPVQQG
jgi:carboxyl-terminal processing protease